MRAERKVVQVLDGKGKYLPLLLLGDEQESLVMGYLERGDLFALEQDGEVLGVCVVTREGPGEYELQNIAIAAEYQRKGLGRTLLEFVCGRYRDMERLCLGTGDSPSTMGFYRALGFRETGRERDYFLRRYDHPIFEDGRQLKDRVYFQKTIAR